MLKRRLTPVLLWRDGSLVQSRGFSCHQKVGSLLETLKRYSHWALDELLIINISANRYNEPQHFLADVQSVSHLFTMPVTLGGGVTNSESFAKFLKAGADKVVLGRAALDNLQLIHALSNQFGSQAVLACLDIIQTSDGYYLRHPFSGDQARKLTPHYIQELETHGIGELVIQSVTRDGSYRGYDTSLLKMVAAISQVPIIALGGARLPSHVTDALAIEGVEAVALGNAFHHSELSYPLLKRKLVEECALDTMRPLSDNILSAR